MVWPITGTADSGGSTTTLKDAPLTQFPNDRFNGAHILLTSGSPTYTELYVTDFVQSTGVATFVPTLGAAPDTLTYEIMPFSGTAILKALQQSVQELYDKGLLIREFWTYMVGGSPLFNADWSSWDSATVPTGWARNGTGTIARERASGNVALSRTSLKLSTAADYVRPDPVWKRFLQDKKGYTVVFYCPVLASNASHARLNLYTGSDNYSAYHSGDGDWELLSIEVAVAESATDLEPRLYNDSTNAVYFGMPFVVGGPAPTEYPLPTVVLPDGPQEVRQALRSGANRDAIASGRGYTDIRDFGRMRQLADWGFIRYHDENTTTNIGLLDFRTSLRPPLPGHLMWLRGAGPLTVPATVLGTETLEVTEGESQLIATLAAIKLLEGAMASPLPSQAQRNAERRDNLIRQFAGLSGGIGQSRRSASLPMRW